MEDLPHDLDPDLQKILGDASPVSVTSIAKMQKAIETATIVFGYDIFTKSRCVLYGREILNDIAKGRDSEWDAQQIVALSYDSRTAELEFLEMMVQRIKGEHDCYQD
jgi:hypothetical protein